MSTYPLPSSNPAVAPEANCNFNLSGLLYSTSASLEGGEIDDILAEELLIARNRILVITLSKGACPLTYYYT